MDKCVKDNKNRYLLTLLSLLTLVIHMRILMKMFWEFVEKVKKTKQLSFGRFDEGFHFFAKMAFHFVVDSRDSKF
jgi:hypothetical protein